MCLSKVECPCSQSFKVAAIDRIDDYGCDIDEWYKEVFFGELHHRFVIHLSSGDWRESALPNLCRALALRPRLVDSLSVPQGDRQLAELSPTNMRLVGLETDSGRTVLCETCGRETGYHLRVGPFGIVGIR